MTSLLSQSKIAERLREIYSAVPGPVRLPRPPREVANAACVMTARGLGDAVVMTGVWKQALLAERELSLHCAYPCWSELSQLCPSAQAVGVNVWMADALALSQHFDCVNGHIIQRICRVWGLPVPARPMGHLTATHRITNPHRVILHLATAGRTVEKQRQLYHPRARQIYPETQRGLEQFVANHPECDFVQVGGQPLTLAGVRTVQPDSVSELIGSLAEAAWFVGIASGPMHVAAALGIKSVVIVNVPQPHELVLPCLRQTGAPEEQWLYPQNVHLHQDGGTQIVPRFSVETLERAFAGEVYPFWSDQWLGLALEDL